MVKFPENPCSWDYKGKHYWERRGFQDGDVIWQCTQCYIGFKERIKFIERRT